MAHLIENMFYLGETPWHGLGTPLNQVPTIEEALELSGMNFEVRKLPTFYHWDMKFGGTALEDDEELRKLYEASNHHGKTGHFVTVRSDTGKPIGNVGKKYEVLQNRDAFAPFEVIQDYGYKLETAGVIDEGKKVWILAKTPDTFQVGDDMIQCFVLLYTSHDGSSGSCFRDTSMRVVCNNTLTWALGKKGGYEYKLRHTSSINSRMKELTDKLDEHQGNVAKAMDDMNRFVEVPMTSASLTMYIEAVMPWLRNRHKESIPEMGIFVRNRAKPTYEKITDLFYNGKGNKGETLWDAYNAITEYHDHEKNHKDWVKGTQFGASHRDKMNAFRIATAMAKHSSNNTTISYN
tara:strand:- start:9616 stop:10662 length:1047 start_codon:yes stop_codon:yes gene_type:complete